MSRMVSKRKRPDRDRFTLKEVMKFGSSSIDDRTAASLKKLFGIGIISSIHFQIASGKEADIYLAQNGNRVKEEVVLLKIFRMETSSFGKREDYIRGDRRFSGKSTDVNKLIGIWCRKEYGNLKIAEEAGVMAPRPYYANGNVLAMEFIGEDGVPSPKLKDMKSEHPERIIEVIFESVRKLSSYGLVHGDMSEYNVLVKNNEPYIIDFGQAVSIDHPRAKEFLERDIHNIATFFRKRYGIEHDESKEVAKALEAADKGGST